MIAYLRTEAASADLVFHNLVEAGNVVIVKDYTEMHFYLNGVLTVLVICSQVRDIN